MDDAERPRSRGARGAAWPTCGRVVRTLADDAGGVRRSSASLDHGDLHGNNVLVASGDGPIRLFDWGDAVVAHPFATLTTTLGSIGHHAGVDPYGPARRAGP